MKDEPGAPRTSAPHDESALEELLSRPTRAHPLFEGLVAAAIDRQRELRLPVDTSTVSVG